MRTSKNTKTVEKKPAKAPKKNTQTKAVKTTKDRQIWLIKGETVVFMKTPLGIHIMVLDKEDGGWFIGWVDNGKVYSEVIGEITGFTDMFRYILKSKEYLSWSINTGLNPQ